VLTGVHAARTGAPTADFMRRIRLDNPAAATAHDAGHVDSSTQPLVHWSQAQEKGGVLVGAAAAIGERAFPVPCAL
jgi:hypothetical protein